MNIISRLTVRQLKMNRKRTLVTICGIIISVAMLTAVPTALVSFMSWMAQKEIYADGNWHMVFYNVTAEQDAVLSGDDRIEASYRNKDIGFGKPEFELGKYKPYLFIQAMDRNAEAEGRIILEEGRMALDHTELVISRNIQEAAKNSGGRELKIGDVIDLSLGERRYYEEDKETGEIREYLYTDRYRYNQDEVFLQTGRAVYTIVGIAKEFPDDWEYSAGFIAVSGLQGETGQYNIYLRMKDISKEVYQLAPELAFRSGVAEEEGYDGIPDQSCNGRITYHSSLMRYQGVSDNGAFNVMMTSLAVITITVIIAGSVALIYNAFAISLSERSKYLGMLASVGATKKQKRYSVLFEGLVLGLISIPVGILSGLAGIGITFRLIAPTINRSILANIAGTGADDIGIKLVISWNAILLAVLCAVITILVSTWIPARKASKISPIDAIRANKEIKLTSRKIKTSKLVTKIFGFEAELGLKNLKRNKGRYRATVFSLVVSVVVFLTMSVLMDYLQSSYRMTVQNVRYDVRASYSASEPDDDFFEDLQAATEYTESAGARTTSFSCTIPDRFVTKSRTPGNGPAAEDVYTEDAYQESFVVELFALDDKALAEYASQTGASMKKLKDTKEINAIIYSLSKREGERKYETDENLTISSGDILPVQRVKYERYPDSYDGHWINQGEPISIQADAVTDVLPIGGEEITSRNRIYVYVSTEVFKTILNDTDSPITQEYYFFTDHWEKLLDELQVIQADRRAAGKDLYLVNIKGEAEQVKQTLTMLKVFTTGFLVLILAICVANIFNTVSTSIALRRREFAMLKSVGMTPKGFRKMINYESIFYGIKALFYGLPLSFLTIWLMYSAINGVFTQSFIIPWGRIAAAVIMVIGVVAVTMLYSSSKVRKGSIVDSLKDENL